MKRAETTSVLGADVMLSLELKLWHALYTVRFMAAPVSGTSASAAGADSDARSDVPVRPSSSYSRNSVRSSPPMQLNASAAAAAAGARLLILISATIYVAAQFFDFLLYIYN